MPKRKINFVKDGYYHIYNRGAGRQSIFREERNYIYLLRLLKKVTAESDVTVIAYCLLPNHYHWLLRQDGDTSAGKVPARVFGSYSQAFNSAYERTGTLFEGPYQAIVVDNDAYLLHLCRYIHLNPVRHGMVDTPQDWPYSNYLEWLGQRPGTMVDKGFVQDHFDTPLAYQVFVSDLLRQPGKLPAALQPYFDDLEG
jgi:REP element-mobilizing transposase RayT